MVPTDNTIFQGFVLVALELNLHLIKSLDPDISLLEREEWVICTRYHRDVLSKIQTMENSMPF